MKIQNLIVSLALWIPLTLTGAPAGTAQTTAVPAITSGSESPVSDFLLDFLLPGDLSPDPDGPGGALQGRVIHSGSRALSQHDAFRIKLNGRPAPALPLPELDASIQLVVGPQGAPSQGTIVHLPGEGYAIVTHDHFNSPALDQRDDLYFKEHGEAFFTGHVDIASDRPDASRYQEVNIIPLGDGYSPRLGATAALAAPETISGIRVGGWVQVVYNAATQAGEFELRVATLQVTRTADTTIQVYDPDRLINKGDSGGAVYFDGELIGVLWSIGEYGYGPGVNVSLLSRP